MLRAIVVGGIIIIGTIILAHRALVNGTVRQYLDSHHNPQWVPAAEYYLGEGYYIFQNLPEAATYFMRVPQDYPKSSRADESFFSYLQVLDDTLGISREVLIDENLKYLERFPDGAHAAAIRERIDTLRAGSR